MHRIASLLTGAGLLALMGLPVACSSDSGRADMSSTSRSQRVAAYWPDGETIVPEWPERPRLAANQMKARYGPPHEVTSEMLAWRNVGPYKCITVTREETPHDFPKPHMDFLEHTVAYVVPVDKMNELTAFDGSVTLDRTAGEMSAKCDLESHNILSLNLANDVATGKLSAEEAREEFARIIMEDAQGKNPVYMVALQFEPAGADAGDPGEANMTGAPMRPDKNRNAAIRSDRQVGDADILGLVVALNESEMIAAHTALDKDISVPVKEFATMMKRDHGKNLSQTLQLAENVGVTPVESAVVEGERLRHAAELADIIPLSGREFEMAFIDLMVQAHTDALDMFDSRLIPQAQNQELKKHLEATREHLAHHLDKAKKIRDGRSN